MVVNKAVNTIYTLFNNKTLYSQNILQNVCQRILVFNLSSKFDTFSANSFPSGPVPARLNSANMSWGGLGAAGQYVLLSTSHTISGSTWMNISNAATEAYKNTKDMLLIELGLLIAL